jgi:hypothetical protein
MIRVNGNAPETNVILDLSHEPSVQRQVVQAGIVSTGRIFNLFGVISR